MRRDYLMDLMVIVLCFIGSVGIFLFLVMIDIVLLIGGAGLVRSVNEQYEMVFSMMFIFLTIYGLNKMMWYEFKKGLNTMKSAYQRLTNKEA
ncbi:hypothetical protein LDL00_11360 [Staphylococcus epidermidis]|uniref:hypothetical protein n=1 Tax=Staphylococcus epidermidis TaxID=1282 RepID=UPI001E60954F|nr:hypothetical protein [Staphylococcus epidermidis]MCD9074421.1 hypothetical protein [Staphylococcus epidermidis]